MIKSLLIANRGEIACRVIRTARAMGIRTVAVYSDADAKALHVRSADEAVHIGPSPARESYLVGEKIIAAAKASGAEAIHPGYGFLSENAEFAQAVMDAGLVWVGPKPASITAMGLKDAAKKLMIAAGVPCTPGYLGDDQDPAHLAAEAGKIGYPVLIKAVAGGGGKGMRLVEAAEDFADALASCQREAASSFGNAHVLIEKYILSPRHIEVQVFGDSHGSVVHLFERDCSLQRRHQKVIEEAPAPGMDEATREAICAAAVRAAKAVNYEGAGTIEFIADGSEGLRADRVWFMEMNTRLQVEHPVTEEITGVDLVEWQLRVASGEPIPLRQDELSINGWAMEARLYAEDPAKGFLPMTGEIGYFRADRFRHCRVDTGVEAGDAVSPYYDPMIAKLIASGGDRDTAIAELLFALNDLSTAPLVNNGSFLYRLLDHPEFRECRIDTGFIARNLEDLLDQAPSQDELNAAATSIAIIHGSEAVHERIFCESVRMPDPWNSLIGLRLNAAPQMAVALTDGERVYTGFLGTGRHGNVPLNRMGNEVHFHGKATSRKLWFAEVRGSGHHGAHDGDILSPMPGKVIAVEVTEGQTVTKGQKLLTLEAMKMEHSLTAPFDGTVAELKAVAGAQVQVDALLARIEAVEE
ncbi:MAG: acetyl/propionyl/methylcrotonyl-CoA carboxylase subunit alpha [Novosphingobium sp.]